MQASWGIEHRTFDYAKELLKDSFDKLMKRNKLLRNADSSKGGRDTVKQYETTPIDSD